MDFAINCLITVFGGSFSEFVTSEIFIQSTLLTAHHSRFAQTQKELHKTHQVFKYHVLTNKYINYIFSTFMVTNCTAILIIP